MIPEKCSIVRFRSRRAGHPQNGAKVNGRFARFWSYRAGLDACDRYSLPSGPNDLPAIMIAILGRIEAYARYDPGTATLSVW